MEQKPALWRPLWTEQMASEWWGTRYTLKWSVNWKWFITILKSFRCLSWQLDSQKNAFVFPLICWEQVRSLRKMFGRGKHIVQIFGKKEFPSSDRFKKTDFRPQMEVHASWQETVVWGSHKGPGLLLQNNMQGRLYWTQAAGLTINIMYSYVGLDKYFLFINA